MIQETVAFILQELNQSLKKKTNSIEDIVVLNQLVTIDGTVSPNTANKVVLSFLHFRTGTTTPSKINSMSILLTPNFNEGNYEISLKLLDLVLLFFQEHSCMKQTDFVHLPQGITQLATQLQDDIKEIRAVWASLGIGYKPSAIYELQIT